MTRVLRRSTASSKRPRLSRGGSFLFLPAFDGEKQSDILGFASGVSGPRGLEISNCLSDGAGAVRCFPGANLPPQSGQVPDDLKGEPGQ